MIWLHPDGMQSILMMTMLSTDRRIPNGMQDASVYGNILPE
jgi:hypothetical protein